MGQQRGVRPWGIGRLVASMLPLLAGLLLALATERPALAEPAGEPDAAVQPWRDARPLEGFSEWRGATLAQAPEQPFIVRTCDELRFDDGATFRRDDRALQPDGDGTRLCAFWNERWQTYGIFLIGQRDIAQFRETKALLQPLLPAAGVELCQVAFWTSPDPAIQQATTLNDRHDAGRTCEPEVIARGPKGAMRVDEVRAALAEIIRAGERQYGWSLRWPLRVYLYDDSAAFVQGNRVEAGDDSATSARLTNTYGRAGSLAAGMRGFLLDVSGFSRPGDLKMLAAHEYAHIAQAGALGCTCALPWFALEGGAEYFASTIVGASQPSLVRRFREAVEDERQNRAIPLRNLIERPGDSEDHEAAGYSRGYAAFRFLAERWGSDAVARVLLAAAHGTPRDFIQGLEQTTGMSLDDFDRALGAYLRAQAPPATAAAAPPSPSPSPRASAAPVPILNTRASPSPSPAATPRPSSTPSPSPSPSPTATPAPAASSRPAVAAPPGTLAGVGTFRPLADDRLEPASRFTRTDTRVVVRIEFGCLPATVRGEVRLIAPTGREFTSFSGPAGPGCGEVVRALLDLDEGQPGQSARYFPGAWRVDLFVDGQLSASLPFVLEP